MASSSSPPSYRYDVFLSFRGEDTRKNFVDHLYKALNDSLIRTYKDDITLPRGESVGPALLEAIDESEIAVIIFSKNYADSSWCLNELVHIMKRRARNGQFVMPIFYDVDPSNVRKQEGEFGKAFSELTKKNVNKAKIWRKLFAKIEAESWRKTLVDASNISGWEPKNIANGHESAVIQSIVDTILGKLLPSNSDILEDFVGMRARVQDFISRLEIGTGGVRMVGIWGIGGGGKTTLAISAYMKIKQHFHGHCIVGKIREESRKYGLKSLQKQMLSTLLKRKVEVQIEEEGKHVIKRRLCGSKVLILLDDVDNLAQLEALAGSHNWFGDGSRIIITTRDRHLLQKVDHVSPVTLLSDDEALLLFNSRAYNEEKHIIDYEKLSLQVLSYASRLPLALTVLGSFLYDKDEKEWTNTLLRLKDIPDTEILEKLKISYDGLTPVDKELFLDIACFFRGKSKDSAIQILDACGFYPDNGITELKNKALITINPYGEFDMHDLIQEMGHYIVRGEHPNNPEKHSRLWKRAEISNMCLGGAITENNSIEAIQYSDGNHLSRFCKMVSSMKKLRCLSVAMSRTKYHQTCVGPIFLSNELRYMFWERYPKSAFPESFEPKNLGVLKIEKSFQKELWKSYKYLPKLKVLQLHKMKKLVSTPDFVGLPCLQKLEIKKCDMLKEIHPSLGNHRSLKYVKVSACEELRMFPTIVQMEKLETLEISSCHFDLEFPEIQANLESLVKLYLLGIGIQDLLPSIGERCTNLISLELLFCFILMDTKVNFHGLKQLKDFNFADYTRPDTGPKVPPSLSMPVTQLSILVLSSFQQLTCSLRILILKGCSLEDGEIPSCIGEISNLTELDLGNNDFSILHFSLLQLHRLKFLNLSGCSMLVELPKLPSRIAILGADDCKSLKTVGALNTNCKWLCQVSLDAGIIAHSDRFLESMLEGKAIENHSMILRVKGIYIPKVFRRRLYDGTECRLQLPKNWCDGYCGFLLCAVLLSIGSDNPRITMKKVTGGSMGMNSQDDAIWKESVISKDTWLWYVSFGSLRHTSWWNPTYNNVSFSIENCIPSRFGVRLVTRKSGTSSAMDSSEFSNEKDDYDYTPKVKIHHDSTYDLKISPREYSGLSMDRSNEILRGWKFY